MDSDENATLSENANGGVVHRVIEELVVEGKRLGRHFHFDPKELEGDFRAPLAPKVVSVMHKATGLPFDQHSTGSCTAQALVGALNTTPNYQPAAMEARILSYRHNASSGTLRTEVDAINLYELETKMEGEPYPPNDPGGTGLMVSRAAAQLGWIKDYAHTYNVQHALMALTLRPVICGMNWYTSFDTPDANGTVTIAPGATVRGGHEVPAVGISIPKRLIFFVNSWGEEWGVPLPAAGVAGGSFNMSFDTFTELLKSEQGGDVTVPLV